MSDEDFNVAEELQMRADLSQSIMDAMSGLPLTVVFDVIAYVVAQCITQTTGVSSTDLLEHFNTRVVDLHRVINTVEDANKTLQ